MKKFLFTTLMSNDLGLLTRSLPIARELRERGHRVAFCNPAKAPAKLIANAGFENLLPEWSLFYIISGDLGSGFSRLFRGTRISTDSAVVNYACPDFIQERHPWSYQLIQNERAMPGG